MNVTVIDAVMGAGKTYWMKRELARRTSMFAAVMRVLSGCAR